MAEPCLCPLCGEPLTRPTCRPGPGWGRVHRRCFIQVDVASEAVERELGARLAEIPTTTFQTGSAS